MSLGQRERETWAWFGLLLAVSVLVGPGSMCFAQTVTIRVINGKGGHPLARQSVTVSFLYDGAEKAPLEFSSQLSLQTDKKGEARFTFPQPSPAHLSATVNIDRSRWRCACNLLDSTQNVVQFGVVVKDEGNDQAPVAARPQEVLFIARPLSLFYRLLGPLEKG